MLKRHIVDLTPDEYAHLVALTRQGKASARQVTRAHILLHAPSGLTDAEIATAAHTSVPKTVRPGASHRGDYRTLSQGWTPQARSEAGSTLGCALL